MSEKRAYGWLLLIVAAFFLLAVSYSIATPLFEAPDEHHHFFTVRHMVQNKRLPQVVAGDELLRQEAAQPPLYYVIAAPLLALFDVEQADKALWFNPQAQAGDFTGRVNSNVFVHRPNQQWPWQGWVAGAHAVRILSAVMGSVTLLCIYQTARLIWPNRPQVALAAAATVAFLPQFGFLNSAISNDPLMILLASAAQYQLVRVWLHGESRGRLLALGVTVGLAVLTKMAGLLLLAWAVAGLILAARSLRWRSLALMLVPALLLAGPLLVRNFALYGDITAVNQFVALAGGVRPYSLGQFSAEFHRVIFSSVAVFGWMSVRAATWVYWLWLAVAVVGLAGWLVGWAASRFELNRLLLGAWLAVWPLLVFAGWVRFHWQTPADQGRLLFAGLLPVALLLGRGLAQWRVGALVAPLLFGVSLFCAAVTVPSAYALPPVIALDDVPDSAEQTQQSLSNNITLIAYELDSTRRYRAGDTVTAKLYWQVSGAVDASLQVVKLFGRNQTIIGSTHAYPGLGLLPQSLWPSSGVIVDSVEVVIEDDAELPVAAAVEVSWLQVDGAVGIGRIDVEPSEQDADESPALAAFANGVDLLVAQSDKQVVQAGETVQVAVRWRVSADISADFTTFVHMGDPTQPPLAQGDSPPLGGAYPTRFWQQGEIIDDLYLVRVSAETPPGDYPIHLGMYDPATGQRAQIGADGTKTAFSLGAITVIAKE